MFRIYGNNREHLWQWDINQKLIVADELCNEVHFCNGKDTCSLVCEVYELDGLKVVDIPNVLLQDNFRVNAFAYVKQTDGSYTEYKECFKVMPRSKPADYIYTETEVKEYETFKAEFEEFKAEFEAIVNFEEVAF